MIEIKNLSYKYKNGNQVLESLNFEINDGEMICIIGNNGVGKSTLLKIISGLLKPTKGEVNIDGLDAYNRRNLKEIRKKVGIVFQNPDNQILFNNVYDEMEFSLKNLNIEKKEIRIKEALNKVKMETYINADTFKLSLGQKQRISIASCLAIKPKYLLLDEPTAMIDSCGRMHIYEIIKNLKNNKQTVVFTTNNMNEILMADRVIVLENGKIKKIITKREILKDILLLEGMNVYIPDLIKLIMLLNQKGFDISIEDYSVDELANEIARKLKI